MALKQDAKARRRRLYTRQMLIYGPLVTAFVVAGVAATAFYFNRADVPEELPWYQDTPFTSPSATPTPTVQQPCPVPPSTRYPSPASIKVTVYNANGQQGLAGGVAETLRVYGFQDPSSDNAKIWEGAVKVVAGLSGINNAYTVLEYMPKDTVLTIDWRTGTAVDVVLGTEFEKLPAAVTVGYDPESPIQPVEGCLSAAEILRDLPKSTPTPTPSPTEVSPPAEGEDETATETGTAAETGTEE
ncbi:MAG: LytR C-terminal domain-containing protein [Bifidobacteriaceae bacterium]|jgi:hypothetical protein|nr:LytR C-terminal domain-containing protein [Bifidobacteriaceae bacterium]